MKTQLLIVYKPNRARALSKVDPNLDNPGTGGLGDPISADNNYAYRSADNPNYSNDLSFLRNVRTFNGQVNVDLLEDTEIPLNYTILDIREPDKRKTNFSKTIVLPGTKNNNRIFNHIYEIGINSKFNPNIRTEVIILQDGVQIMRGNMQLKNIVKFNNNDINYEVLITGDFTSLFADIGISKLRDLDFSQYRHIWNRNSVQNSWDNIVRDSRSDVFLPDDFLPNPEPTYEFSLNVDQGAPKNFTSIGRQASTGRVMITTTSNHDLNSDDWVRITPDTDPRAPLIEGDFAVSEIISPSQFTINYPFPDGLYNNALGGSLLSFNPTGKGYVYPMISWGDDALINGTVRFPTQAFSMAFYTKEIWDKIFEKTNSRYESNFINSNFFKRLILTQKKTNYELPPTEIQGRSFKVSNVTQWQIQTSGTGTQDGDSILPTRAFPQNTNNLQPYTFASSIAASDGFLYNGVPGETPFNQDTSKWVVTDNGVYSLSFNITFDCKVDMSNFAKQVSATNWSFDPPVDVSTTKYFWGGWPSGAFDEGINVSARLRLKSNGVTTTINENIWRFRSDSDNVIIKDTFKNWRFEARSISVSFTDRYLRKDDEVWVEVYFLNNFNNTINGLFTFVENIGGNPQGANPPKYYMRRGKFFLRTLGIQILENKPGGTITENSEVFPEGFLPKDLSCRDFLLGIIRMFNLHIEADKEIEKFYRIEPRDEYYKDGSGGLDDYVDWTDKVDLNQMDIIPMGELTAKFYNFEYKSESDFWNKKYLDDTGKVYGNYVKEVQNDFLNNEQKITLPFGSTVMINNPESTAMVMPQVVQRDNNNINKPTNVAVKLLFWGGRRPTSKGTSPYTWNYVQTSQSAIGPLQTAVVNYTNYPYAGTCDSPFDPEIDLNWFYTDYVYWNRARWSNQNLYNKYWRTFIEEITDPDSKVIKARVNLKAKDINALDFRKIYVINGHYLRLQKIIDYNANGEGLTQCEFLKLKSPSKFRRRSIPIGNRFSTTIDNTRPISVSESESPPQDFTNRNPLSNYSSSELSAQNTINFNGENNVVSDGSTNVNISGNENFVGSSSKNISISGDGVFVSGGLQNVNIIGTNKIIVEENDVTYINGIRYKNGVAISKSNVIDGGLNIVLNRSAPNTTINIIDAGEDVVIPYGSATYENVINAGIDRILPDVPNYGVSTLTSFNPSTNLTGAVWKTPGLTLSTIDEIQSRVDPVPFSNI